MSRRKSGPVAAEFRAKRATSLRILVAEDDGFARQYISRMIPARTPYKIVGEAESGKQAVDLALTLKPDVILMDPAMPVMDGIEATRCILGKLRSVKILAVSSHSETKWIRSMLAAGACGYLLKGDEIDPLIVAIEAVVAGKCYLSPEIVDAVVDDYAQRRDAKEPSCLTATQRRILGFIRQGLSIKEIATSIGVSSKAVYNHRQRIMGKLGLSSCVELVTRFPLD